MRVRFMYSKTGGEWVYECNMDAIPRIGEVIYIHPLRYVESVPREIKEVIWFAKNESDGQVDVKVVLS